MSSNGEIPPSPPRLCHMVLAPDFKGYGFNLHTVKEKPGQFIGQVDEGSPAERALLKQGDRIVEVNGVNIANENHKQVVTRVKAIDNETRLLVVDKEADAWYKQHNIVVTSQMSEVVKASSLTRRPSSASSDLKSDDRRSVGSVGSGSSAVNSEPNETQSPVSISPSPPSSVGSPSPTPNNAPDIPGLNLNMSAAEMRVYLASKKKRDIRHDSIDMKRKHQIIQRL